MNFAILSLYAISLATSMGGMELFGALIVFAYLFDVGRHGLRWEKVPFAMPLILFVAVSILGIFMGSVPMDQKWFDVGRMRFFLFYFILFQALWRWDRDFRLLKPLFAITVLVGIYGFVQHFVAIDLFRPEGKKVLLYAIPTEKIGPLVVGTFNHHLTFAGIYFFYASLITSLAFYDFPKKIWRLCHGLFLFLLCAWTQSRAAWAAIPVALLSLASTQGKRFVTLTMIGISLGAGLFYSFDSGFRERLTRTLNPADDYYQLGERRRLWKAQIEFFKESPLWGVGFNNNERRSKEMVDKLYPDRKENFYGHAHSNLFQILATTGLMGMAAYLWLWWEILSACYRVCRKVGRHRQEFWLSLGVGVGFLGFHIQGITQWNFGDAEVLHNVVFFWAMTAILSRRSLVA